MYVLEHATCLLKKYMPWVCKVCACTWSDTASFCNKSLKCKRSDQSLRVHCRMHTHNWFIRSVMGSSIKMIWDLLWKLLVLTAWNLRLFVSCTLHEYDLENMIFCCCNCHFWNTCGCIMQRFLMIQYFFSRLLYLV